MNHQPNMTPRELQVCNCLLNGLKIKEISTKLTISESTVKVHLGNIYKRHGFSGGMQDLLIFLLKPLNKKPNLKSQ